MTDDPTLMLLRRAADGDREAYAQVVEMYSERIRRVTYLLLHCPVRSEDVTQETFTQALARLASYRREGDPSSWFLSIALNLCRKELRDQKRHAQSVAPRELEAARRIRRESHGILTSVVRRETAQSLALALGFLTRFQKEVFVLHYVEDLPYEQVAELMGTSVGAVRALGHRARQVLQEKLESLAPTEKRKLRLAE